MSATNWPKRDLEFALNGNLASGRLLRTRSVRGANNDYGALTMVVSTEICSFKPGMLGCSLTVS